jgi:hypothetical protein
MVAGSGIRKATQGQWSNADPRVRPETAMTKITTGAAAHLAKEAGADGSAIRKDMPKQPKRAGSTAAARQVAMEKTAAADGKIGVRAMMRTAKDAATMVAGSAIQKGMPKQPKRVGSTAVAPQPAMEKTAAVDSKIAATAMMTTAEDAVTTVEWFGDSEGHSEASRRSWRSRR